MRINKLSHKRWCVVLMACLTIVTACTDEEESDENITANPITVRTAVATAQTLRPYIELNGSIEAKNSVQVYPNIAGKIAGTRVNLGSAVKKGDILALVDPSLPGASYVLSQVTAPISGNVISIPPQPGVKVTTDTSIITIRDLSQLKIKTYIPEKFFGMLKPGLSAEVKVEAYPNAVFDAAIKSVAPVVDAVSRTVETIFLFNRRDNRITAGMFCKIKLYLSSYENAVTVVESAITQRDNQSVVFLLTDECKAKSQPITVGVSVDSMVQILDGLSVGQTIIIDGLNALQDGSEVNVLNKSK